MNAQKNIFDAYIKLQTETYELIGRNMLMNKSLTQAHSLLKENPDITREEASEKISNLFEGIYGNLTSVFLERLKIMAEPYGQFFKAPSEATATPGIGHEWYMNMFKIWTETQPNFLKATATGYQRYMEELEVNNEEKKDPLRKMIGLTPFHLLKDIADEGSGAYLESIGHVIEAYGQNQFLFPKKYFIHLRNWVSSSSNMLRLLNRYEKLFRDGWKNAKGDFVNALFSTGKSPSQIEYDEFYDMFCKNFSGEYCKLLGSKEFVEAQNDVMNTVCDIFYNLRQMTEAQHDMSPMSPFVMRTEVDTVEKRLYDYSKKGRELDREVKSIKKQLKASTMNGDINEKLTTLSKKETILTKNLKEIKDQLKTTLAHEDLDKLTTKTTGDIQALKTRVEGIEKLIQDLSAKLSS